MKFPRRDNIHSFRDKNRRNYQARFLKIGLVVLVLFGLGIASIGLGKTKDGLLSFSGILFKARAQAIDTLSQVTSSVFESKKSIIAERDILKNQVADLEAQIASLTALKDENEKLQEMLGRKSEKIELVLGRIVAKPNQSPYDTLVIDAGSDDGIIDGARVLARGDIAIGTVVETAPHISKIKLYSTSGEKTKGAITGKDIFIDLVGTGAGTFEATLPRDVVVEKGTPVVLPDGGNVVAIVEEQIVDPRDPFQKILFRSPVNLFELRFVGVEK